MANSQRKTPVSLSLYVPHFDSVLTVFWKGVLGADTMRHFSFVNQFQISPINFVILGLKLVSIPGKIRVLASFVPLFTISEVIFGGTTSHFIILAFLLNTP